MTLKKMHIRFRVLDMKKRWPTPGCKSLSTKYYHSIVSMYWSSMHTYVTLA